MRRFVTLAFLLLFTVPFGISISGCGKKTAVVFCSGGDSGPVVGQLTTLTLQPKIYGISLNVGQFGQSQTPTGTDCKGTTVTIGTVTFGTSDMTTVDIVPTSGRLCAGLWNRNTGGGIPDYTVCNPTNKIGTAYITASQNGATSNPIPVFVHPVVTSVVLGVPSTNCAVDQASNCSPAATNTNVTTAACTVDATTGCCTVPPVSTAGSYDPNTCLSQTTSGQLAARVYGGTQAAGTLQNISCRVGHLTYTPQTTSIVTIDENGIATAQQPGSTIITSSLTNAGSTAGFFSTCPPASITLTAPGTVTGANGVPEVTVNQNNTLPITAVVTDTKGALLTGISLNYLSTTPTTLPSGGAATATPIYPGSGSITAVCQPPTCNTSPLNSIGIFGNGKPVTSNNIVVNTPGANSSILYTASTQSMYFNAVDFTTTTIGTNVRLPYIPNSMVISEDGNSIYMGSATELMVISALNNSLSREDLSVPGTVLAVSPDSATLVITDPNRKTVSLASAAGGTQTTYGGVGTHAEWSPDSSTVYITTGTQILVHSTFTGWSAITPAEPVLDVAVAVPSVGAFFAGTTTTARSYCPVSASATANATIFYPDAGVTAPASDRLAATDDGIHILSATASGPTLTDLRLSNGTSTGLPNGQCPVAGTAPTFTATPVDTATLPTIAPTAITGIYPTSDSLFAFITYTGTGGVLPLYQPANSGQGTLSSIKLSGAAIAPVNGVFSADNSTFFVGTTGDNVVHLLTRSSGTFTDSSSFSPNLPDASGNIVTPNLLVQRPHKIT